MVQTCKIAWLAATYISSCNYCSCDMDPTRVYTSSCLIEERFSCVQKSKKEKNIKKMQKMQLLTKFLLCPKMQNMQKKCNSSRFRILQKLQIMQVAHIPLIIPPRGQCSIFSTPFPLLLCWDFFRS